jgi:hypothetical protein
MRTLIGVVLAATLTLGVAAQAAPATAGATAAKSARVVSASDVSARRHYRHYRYAYRPNSPYPMYYGRPVYYAPALFLPIPPLWGYGWEWW